MVNEDEISKLLTLSEGELFTAIGADLKPFGFALDKRQDPDKEKDGRDWYQTHVKRLRASVCQNEKVQMLLSSKRTFGRVELVAAIIDLVGLVTTGVSPALVSVVIVKRGLAEFCSIENE